MKVYLELLAEGWRGNGVNDPRFVWIDTESPSVGGLVVMSNGENHICIY